MRLLAFVLLDLAMEVGWLALWPISVVLSHSAAFTSELLATHEPVARLVQFGFRVARFVPGDFLPGATDTPIAEPLGAASYVAPAVGLAVLMLLMGIVYLLAVRLLERGFAARRSTVWLVLAGALVFQTTLMFLPGLFSQDVFSYVAYGRLAAIYDLNPYVWPPSAIPRDAVLSWVAEVWRAYAAPYGPVWLDVQWLMARIFGGTSIAEQALAYRLLANVLLLANLGLAWLALGRLALLDRAQRTTALAVLAWNPLVLFEVGANAHNDVLMVTFSLLALALFARSSNGALAGASFTLGALVKYLSGVGLGWVAIAFAARAHSWKWQLVRLAMVGLLSGALALAVAWPWLELPDSLEPILAETVGVGFVNALPDAFAVAVADQLLAPAGVPQILARELTRSVERVLVVLGFGAYLVWEARRVWSDPTALTVVRASARSALSYILLVSTSMQPWYFCLPLALAVPLGWQSGLTRVIVGYSLLAVPALYLSYYVREATPFWVTLAYGVAPVVPLLAVPLLRRAHARPHEPAAVDVGHDEQRAGGHRVARAIMEKARR